MNKDNEKISAWLDDANDSSELESLQLTYSSQSVSTAVRYQMIGDAVRGKVTDASLIDISASVREAINQEPEFKPVVRTARSSRRDSTRNARPLFDFGSWLRPVGGLAVAATVAMVMVVTLTDQQTGTDNAVVANVGQQPVKTSPVKHAPVYAKPGIAIPAVNLNSYVTDHTEYAAQDTLQGMMPYARSVSYGAEKNPSLKHPVNNRQNLYPATATNPGR